jgi:ubiquinol-cytochrome c reductase cytochrome b subunit
MHYSGDIVLAFKSIIHISRDVNYGFLLKSIHANGASLFFLCVYIHIGKALYYGGYQKKFI